MMTKQPEEDEDEQRDVGAATRRAWYAGHQSAEPLESASFRGVPGVRHGGAQTVRPEQTAGSMDLCWCGKPFDHDWAGKSGGRSHPRKEDPLIKEDKDMPTSPTEVPVEEQQRIERRALRAYNTDLADLIMTAVNEYHVKYRLTAHSVILFPPDGTQHYAINARNGERQVRGARIWFAKHCVPQDQPIKVAAKKAVSQQPVGEADVKELAEALNSPEHLPKPEEAKADPPQQPVPTMVATKKAPAKKATNGAAKKAAAPPPEPAATEPVAADFAGVQGVQQSDVDAAEWVPYYTGKGKGKSKHAQGIKHPFYVTNGTLVKCTKCDEIIGPPTSTGGHTRTHHTDTTSLWGSEAKKKAINTYFTNKAAKKVEDAIGLLYEAIGVEPPQPVDTSALEAENKELQAKIKELGTGSAEVKDLKAQNAALTTELTELKTKLSDIETKQALAREALGL